MKSLLLSLSLLISVNLFAQIEVGSKAPPIEVNWVDNPNATFKEIADKAMVLDFWFTSCAPCVYTIPHLNDLAEKYKEDDITFVAISFEDKEALSFFLDKKKLLANIGSDTSYTTINQFGVKSYPTTFLIDKKGIIRWEGHATHLKEEQIDLLLGKKYYSTVEGAGILPETSTKDFKKDLIYPISVEVNNYMDGASGMQFNEGELSIVNYSLSKVLSDLVGKNAQRIEVADTNLYDVRFKIPNELPKEKVMEAITKSLVKKLNLELKEESRMVNGYELLVENDSLFLNNAVKPGRQYQGGGSSTTRTHWKGTGVKMISLIKYLENRFGIYIDDKTQMNGFFEFEIAKESIAVASESLMSQYGLKLVNKEIEVTFTIVK